VHIAPGHGYEDYQAGLRYNLPIVSPVNESGEFTNEAPDFEGQYVFDANKQIIEKLKKDQLLLYNEELLHSYPCCWRCKSPLIFRATAQWFLKIDHKDLRKRCIDEIEKVTWIPGWSKDRIMHSVRERPDWCLSRQRTWGIPIPALYCKKCNESILDLKVIEKAEEVTRNHGSEGWLDLEDFGDLSCPKCGSKEFKKEQNIFDVGFDSSSSWTVIRDQGSFPANLYCEGVDQHRGWFQHSLWLSLIVQGQSSFSSVLTHGLVLDSEMRKMSKSLGNVVSPTSIVDKYGADVLRLCFSSLDYTSDLPFDSDTLESVVIAYRKMRNTFKFLLGNLYDFEKPVDYKELLELDKLMLHRLALLTKGTKEAYENFEFHKVYRNFYDFCVVDLSKFYFDILKDRLYTSGKTSLDRRSAQTVLREILISLAQLSAPVTPFTAEEVWQEAAEGLGFEPGSIHLQLMPEPNPEWIDNKLSADYETIEEVRNDVLVGIEEARKTKVIGKSLDARVTIWTEDESLRNFLNEKLDLLPGVFIVSQVSIDKLPDMHALKRIAVTVEEAKGAKCDRCWIRSEDVGKNSDYPELCPKCADVLKEGDYEQKGTGAV
jgi:isoleucyl-tRNA synthetase